MVLSHQFTQNKTKDFVLWHYDLVWERQLRNCWETAEIQLRDNLKIWAITIKTEWRIHKYHRQTHRQTEWLHELLFGSELKILCFNGRYYAQGNVSQDQYIQVCYIVLIISAAHLVIFDSPVHKTRHSGLWVFGPEQELCPSGQLELTSRIQIPNPNSNHIMQTSPQLLDNNNDSSRINNISFNMFRWERIMRRSNGRQTSHWLKTAGRR